jgi:hypothetical protein
MGDPFRKLTTGAAPTDMSVRGWNAAMDVAQAYLRSNGLGPPSSPSDRRSSGIIKVKNNSGSDKGPFSILGIDDSIFDPTDTDELESFKLEPAVVGVTPTSDHKGKFVILLEGIPQGETGDCWAAGVAIVQVAMNSPDDKFAEVNPSDASMLTSASSGTCAILTTSADSGTAWCYVRFGGGGGGGGGSFSNCPATIDSTNLSTLSKISIDPGNLSDYGVLVVQYSTGCMGPADITDTCCGG